MRPHGLFQRAAVRSPDVELALGVDLAHPPVSPVLPHLGEESRTHADRSIGVELPVVVARHRGKILEPLDILDPRDLANALQEPTDVTGVDACP